ncbi:hypothetical protein KOR34_26710 [Posidoniimonas corsicana]|uniref:Uncharacterized protein n=1 Tax=Posidoniimonas corsicana TaxID=1938618 RepID=A0A5C5VIK4_9BACT|nr:hypothetical protein [Posidoniimonas corsicana]TWT37709.1 hypothetical protein KOR34_26710 [Posidoniimonas corsicana]
MSNEQLYEQGAFDYLDGSDVSSRRRPNASKERRPQRGRTRGKAPQSVNGIHRRRRRKVAW